MENLISKLLELISSENKTKAEEVAADMRSFVSDLDKKINKEEVLRNDAYDTRDKAKKALRELEVALALKEGETLLEAVENLKKKKDGDKTEAMKQKDVEIEALKNEVVKKAEEVELVKKSKEKEVAEFVVAKEVAEAASKYKAKTNAIPYLTDTVKKAVSIEDGKPVFRDNSGATMRKDGVEITVSDYVGMLRKKEEEANEEMFFNTKVQESGGSGDGGDPLDSTGDFVP